MRAKTVKQRLTRAQRDALQEYQDRSGFEPFMGREEFDRGEITFNQLWEKNVEWLRDLAEEIDRCRPRDLRP